MFYKKLQCLEPGNNINKKFGSPCPKCGWNKKEKKKLFVLK